jgi:hypothetical protein
MEEWSPRRYFIHCTVLGNPLIPYMECGIQNWNGLETGFYLAKFSQLMIFKNLAKNTCFLVFNCEKKLGSSM